MRIYTPKAYEVSDDEIELVSGLAEIRGIAIENAGMYDHLKTSHELLFNDVHRWFDYIIVSS